MARFRVVRHQVKNERLSCGGASRSFATVRLIGRVPLAPFRHGFCNGLLQFLQDDGHLRTRVFGDLQDRTLG